MHMDMMMRYCTSFPCKIIKKIYSPKLTSSSISRKHIGTNGAYDDPQTPIGTAGTYNEV
jgi:hypothetical protein